MSETGHMSGIREAVLLAGSQQKFAERIGVTQQTVHAWLVQGYVPMARVTKIEDLFGIARERLCNPKFLDSVKNGRED